MNSQHAVENAFAPFSFAVITDLHLSERQGMAQFDRFVEMIDAREDIDFVLVLGDLIWTEPMDELQALMARIRVPMHMFYGNNDAGRLAEYAAAFGPADKTFEHNGCLFVLFWDCLGEDSLQNHMGDISPEQWAWLEGELTSARQRGVQQIFLASHVPPTCPNGYYAGFYLFAEAEQQLWDLCRRHNVTACFFGHLHQDDVFSRHGTEMIVTPSLNWNFVPPAKTGQTPLSTWEIVDEGFFRVVQVSRTGISHALVPLNPPDGPPPGRP